MEKCPACERELKYFLDFPRVLITGFNRFEIPEIILNNVSGHILLERMGDIGIPKDIVKKLKRMQGQSVLREGNIIYCKLPDSEENKNSYGPGIKCFSAEDITDWTRELLERDLIKSHLSKLESLVGKEISRQELSEICDFALTTYKFSSKGIAINEMRDESCVGYFEGLMQEVYSQLLHRNYFEIPKDDSKKIMVSLNESGEYGCHMGGCIISKEVPLAVMRYEGRLNQ